MRQVRHLIPEFEKLKERLPKGLDSTLVLPCLRRIQEDRGYIADEDIDGLVEYLDVPRIQIEEVLTFYSMLRRKPIGRFHLQVCHNVSCTMRGAERMIDSLSRRLGVQPGQTTPDGRFTLSRVECLGSCGTAPVVMVNERYHELQSEESLEQLVAELERS
ncbi:MAG: NADH-quinone oxidoreductase [Gammaproteobacteria bacterium SG8_30]|nr:MAG: NADH-quinone oxidoreductase [Gammaproteobacteria bacterium SG8_30]